MSLGTYIISLEINSMAVNPRYYFAGNIFHGCEAGVNKGCVHSCGVHISMVFGQIESSLAQNEVKSSVFLTMMFGS
jgi:hypothetical protein